MYSLDRSVKFTGSLTRRHERPSRTRTVVRVSMTRISWMTSSSGGDVLDSSRWSDR